MSKPWVLEGPGSPPCKGHSGTTHPQSLLVPVQKPSVSHAGTQGRGQGPCWGLQSRRWGKQGTAEGWHRDEVGSGSALLARLLWQDGLLERPAVALALWGESWFS